MSTRRLVSCHQNSIEPVRRLRKAPHIKTALPGPKAKAIVERDEQVHRACLWTGLSAGGATELARHGRRRRRRQLCFSTSWPGSRWRAPATPTRAVVKAIEEQARKFCIFAAAIITTSQWWSWPRSSVALAPGAAPARKCFSPTPAPRLSRRRIKLRALSHQAFAHRSRFTARFTAGRWARCRSTASRASHRATLRSADSRRAPCACTAFATAVPYQLKYGSCGIEVCQRFGEISFRHDVRPEEVAAIFVEPVQGEGGYVGAAAGVFADASRSLPKVRHSVRRRRNPDPASAAPAKCLPVNTGASSRILLVPAKGIASGMPLGAMIARADIST